MHWFPVSLNSRFWLVLLAGVLLSISGCAPDERSEGERVAMAQQSVAQGRYREAIIEMRNLLLENRNSVDARLILGAALLESGDMDTAQKEAFRARDLGATPKQYLEILARSLQGTGNHVEVISEIDPSGIEDPVLASTLRSLRGWSMLELGSVDQASTVFDEELEAGVSVEAQRIALLGKASLAVDDGELAQAELHLLRALELLPNEPESLLALGRVYISQSKYQNVKTLLAPARNGLVPAEPQEKFFIEGQYTEALLGLGQIKEARKSVALLENLGVAHPMYAFLKGRVEFQSGNTGESISLFQQVLAEYPNYTPALTLMGVALIQRDDIDQAEMFLTRSVANDPGNVRARRLLAETRLRMGRNRAAVRTLKDGLSRDYDDVELLSMLGRATMREGDQDEGLKYLQAAYAADPDSPNAGVVLASAYLTIGNSAEAIRILRSIPEGAIEKNRRDVLIRVANLDSTDQTKAEAQIEQLLKDVGPGDTYIMGLAGSFYAATAQVEKARALFNDILAVSSDNRAAMLNILNLDERSGDYSQSQAMFEAAHAADQSELLPVMVLARIYEAKGEGERAIELVSKANQRDPSALLPNLMLAANALRKEDYVTADEFASVAATNYPRSARAHALYGLAKMNLGQLTEFKNAFERAVVIEPDNVEYNYYFEVVQSDTPYLPAMRSLAILHAEIGRSSQADKLVADIRARFGTSRQALVAVGEIRAAQVKVEEAEIAFESAQQIKPSWFVASELYNMRKAHGIADPTQSLREWKEHAPGDSRPQQKIAQYHHETGNSSVAIKVYEQTLVLQPDSVISRNNLAWLYFERGEDGDLEQALTLAQSAYELSEQNPAIADTYGWLLFQSGEVQKSRDILRTAFLATGPEKSPDIAYHYAVIQQEKDGLASSAREILDNALNSDRPFASRREAQKLLDSINAQMRLIEEKRMEDERLAKEEKPRSLDE